MSSVTRFDVNQGPDNSHRMLLIAEHNRLTGIISSASQSLLNKPPLEQDLFSWVNHGLTILNEGQSLCRLPAAAVQLQAQITILAQSTLERIAVAEEWTDAQIQTLLQFHHAACRSCTPDIFGPLFAELVDIRNSAVSDYALLWNLHVDFFSTNCLNTFLTCCSKPFIAVHCNGCISASEKALLSPDLYEAVLIKEELDKLPAIGEDDLNALESRLNAWCESRLKCESFDTIEGVLKTRVHLAKWEHLASKDIGETTKASLLKFNASFNQDPQFKILNDAINQIRTTLFERVEIREWTDEFKKAQNIIRESFPLFLKGDTSPTTGFNQLDFSTFYNSLPASKRKEALRETRDSHLSSLSDLSRFLSKYLSVKRKPLSTIANEDLDALEACKVGIYESLMTEPISNLRSEVLYSGNNEITRTRQDLRGLDREIAACKTEREAFRLQTKLNEMDATVSRLSKIMHFVSMKKELNMARKQIDALIDSFH